MPGIGRIVRILLPAGAVIAALGLAFTAQSKSALGPQSSFMYNNPEWTINGLAVTALGFVVVAAGVLLYFYGRQRKSRNGSTGV